MKSKKASESLTIATELVLPNHTNTLGNLMGGNLLYWMDATAAICAHRHAEEVTVTASVNHVAFNHPIKLGDFVTLEAKVSRAFKSSMEIYIDVMVDDIRTNEKIKCNEAIYTFVAIDADGNKVAVPELIPETDIEKERYDAALRRRQLALILAGKLNPSDATELKKLFE
tara:strand:+ start:2119 stop:2628 length:510 start_codon:yes stop_codon:yes gene_type:complete